jgi:hypothetical protein
MCNISSIITLPLVRDLISICDYYILPKTDRSYEKCESHQGTFDKYLVLFSPVCTFAVGSNEQITGN